VEHPALCHIHAEDLTGVSPELSVTSPGAACATTLAVEKAMLRMLTITLAGTGFCQFFCYL